MLAVVTRKVKLKPKLEWLTVVGEKRKCGLAKTLVSSSKKTPANQNYFAVTISKKSILCVVFSKKLFGCVLQLATL